MHDPEKSDSGIVAMKPTNKAGRPVAEPVEPRPGTKGNAEQQSTLRTQGRERVTQALGRVRLAARQRKKEQFTALLHHINVDTLRTAFYALKRKAAPGVDGMTWEDYEADLELRIEDLHGRVHRGAYRPQPSRRVYIDKADGKQRPLSILANIYLHYCFDLWAERWRRREARGDMIVVRYADDLVIGFEHEGDARRFLDAMRDRLEEFALSLHPDKTRLIEFGRFAANDRKLRGLGKPEPFTSLGFTFICGRSRRGNFQLQRKTRRDRMRGKLRDIKAELRRRMHQPIPEQGKWLRQVVAGHFAYYAVPSNSRALSAFRHYVTDLWRRTLRRRSEKGGFTWERMTKLVADWLPPPRILHPWPDERFDVRHPR